MKALDTLQKAIARRDCFAVVTGEPGTGKTTLCRTLVYESPRSVVISLLVYPPATPEDLLTAMLSELGVVSAGRRSNAPAPTRDELMKTLQEFLQSVAALGATTVLIIDEAQGLALDVLQQVQVLAGVGEQPVSPLQVVLVGQSTLPGLLRTPELRPLDERLAVRCEFRPLSEEETGAYVHHRMHIADPEHTLTFAADALGLVHQCSNGIPRLVNLICHRAVIAAQGNRAAIVDSEMLMGVIADLELAPPMLPRRSWFGRFKPA